MPEKRGPLKVFHIIEQLVVNFYSCPMENTLCIEQHSLFVLTNAIEAYKEASRGCHKTLFMLFACKISIFQGLCLLLFFVSLDISILVHKALIHNHSECWKRRLLIKYGPTVRASVLEQ